MVLFPGWYVTQDNATKAKAWVLTPKRLPAFLDREPGGLSAENVAPVSSRLDSKFAAATAMPGHARQRVPFSLDRDRLLDLNVYVGLRRTRVYGLNVGRPGHHPGLKLLLSEFLGLQALSLIGDLSGE